MRRRQNMTAIWAYLDRNDDDQLSVAEYAIWAIRSIRSRTGRSTTRASPS